MISGGMVLGSMTGKAIDKMLKVDETATGFQVKKLIRPLALLGAGVVGSMKLKNPDLKMVSAGVGAAGVVSTVKVVLKKDLLAGLGGSMSGLGEPMSVYHEPVRMMEPYEPNLPALSSGSYTPVEDLSNAYPVGEEVSAYQDAEFEII
ncbi:hypothetical protein N9M15_06630 [Bacteroidia bacterium]|nr:hypothetical protein [Bacteroidia bacterium]